VNINAVSSSAALPSTSSSRATATTSTSFTDKVTGALESLDNSHQFADSLANAAATGDLESLTSYVVAATEAQLATQVTVSVRNKAISSFNQIMGMNI